MLAHISSLTYGYMGYTERTKGKGKKSEIKKTKHKDKAYSSKMSAIYLSHLKENTGVIYTRLQFWGEFLIFDKRLRNIL